MPSKKADVFLDESWVTMGVRVTLLTQRAKTADLDTRQRIKVAARRLFAERGVEAVTVREILASAGAKNGGSLNYYFKSKDSLIEELIADFFRDSSDILLDGIQSLERMGGPQSVRDVVTILVASYKPVTDPSPTAVRFLFSLLSTRRRMVNEFMERMHISVFSRMLQYIANLRPDIPPQVLRQRWIYFAWYLVSAQSAYEAYLASNRKSAIWTDTDPIINMIDTATALIEAPCSTTSTMAAPRKRRQVTSERLALAAARRKKGKKADVD